MNKLFPIVAILSLPVLSLAQNAGTGKVSVKPATATSKKMPVNQAGNTGKAVGNGSVVTKKAVADTTHRPVKNVQKVIGKKRKVVASPREEIIELNNNNTRTVVEINKGKVLINGEVVSTIDNPKTDRHRIIINQKDVEGVRTPDSDPAESYIHKPLLGVYTEKNKDYEGAWISSVVKNSPADEAGLLEGDIITKINSKEVHDPESLVEVINDHNGGERVTVTYTRKDREYHAEVILASSNVRRRHETYEYTIPDLHGERRFPTPYLHSFLFNNIDNAFEYAPTLGIEAQDSKNGSGVMVVSVKRSSPAFAAGLKEGDEIVRLDHIRVRSVDDIQDVLNDTWPNQRITIEFKRDGIIMFAYVRFSKDKIKKDL